MLDMLKLIQGIFDQVIGLINKLLGKLADIAMAALPDSPLPDQLLPAEVQNILGYVNWFVPMGTMRNIMLLWLGAVGIYYIYQAILRWAKAID
jgi:hypothetical protein